MKRPPIYLVARALIAVVFIGLGAERLLTKAGLLTGREVPGAAGVGFSLFELLVGCAIAAGWQAGRLALLMAAFLVVDAFAAHPFWKFEGAAQHDQLLHFLKNLSVIGGLLLIFHVESARRQKPVAE